MLGVALGVGWLCVEVRGGEVAADGQGHEILAGGKRLQPVGSDSTQLDSTLFDSNTTRGTQLPTPRN